MAKGSINVTAQNIFPIIKKFLYSDHEIFLRELVSNAVDATQKLKTLTNLGEAKGELGDLTIHIKLDKKAKTLSIIDRGDSVLNEQVNREVADFVSSHDCEVQRFPGKQVLSCEKLQSKNDLGFVGQVTQVNTDPILQALDEGKMPILSSTASDSHGVCYNVNADNVASQVAMALGARRLVYLSDVPGLLRNPEDPSTLLSSLAISEVKPLEEAGVISAGMLPKVTSAVEALKAGVNRVHFIDGRMPHSILLEIFTDQGIGTEIVHA